MTPCTEPFHLLRHINEKYDVICDVVCLWRYIYDVTCHAIGLESRTHIQIEHYCKVALVIAIDTYIEG